MEFVRKLSTYDHDSAVTVCWVCMGYERVCVCFVQTHMVDLVSLRLLYEQAP